MVIPTIPSSVRKPMASNEPVYLRTRRAEIGIVQSTQQMTLPQAVVHLDVTAAEQIILILARLCGGRRLISYNPAMLNQHRQIEIYVGKVIHGALPADLPIQQPWRPHPPGHNSKPNLERLGYFRKRPRRSTENQRGHCKAIHYSSPRAGEAIRRWTIALCGCQISLNLHLAFLTAAIGKILDARYWCVS